MQISTESMQTVSQVIEYEKLTPSAYKRYIHKIKIQKLAKRHPWETFCPTACEPSCARVVRKLWPEHNQIPSFSPRSRKSGGMTLK